MLRESLSLISVHASPFANSFCYARFNFTLILGAHALMSTLHIEYPYEPFYSRILLPRKRVIHSMAPFFNMTMMPCCEQYTLLELAITCTIILSMCSCTSP